MCNRRDLKEVLEGSLKTTSIEGTHMAANRDPSPTEIAAACLLIQATWTPEERLKRLRVDLRPHYTRCDRVTEAMAAEDYEGHHTRRAELQESA